MSDYDSITFADSGDSISTFTSELKRSKRYYNLADALTGSQMSLASSPFQDNTSRRSISPVDDNSDNEEDNSQSSQAIRQSHVSKVFRDEEIPREEGEEDECDGMPQIKVTGRQNSWKLMERTGD